MIERYFISKLPTYRRKSYISKPNEIRKMQLYSSSQNFTNPAFYHFFRRCSFLVQRKKRNNPFVSLTRFCTITLTHNSLETTDREKKQAPRFSFILTKKQKKNTKIIICTLFLSFVQTTFSSSKNGQNNIFQLSRADISFYLFFFGSANSSNAPPHYKKCCTSEKVTSFSDSYVRALDDNCHTQGRKRVFSLRTVRLLPKYLSYLPYLCNVCNVDCASRENFFVCVYIMYCTS